MPPPETQYAEFADRVVVVTGGAGGIGRSIAESFLGHGAVVVLLDNDEDAVRTAMAELAIDTDSECHAIHVDLTDPPDVKRAVAEAADLTGRLDVLVNNAGISPKRHGRRLDVWDTPPELWRAIVDCNLNGVFYASQAACERMRAADNGGAIVNISSLVRSVWTGSSSAAYIASKAGVDGLTRALAMELLPWEIRVNAVAPGRVRTPMTEAASADVWQRALGTIPLGRAADPQEIASAVLFLASSASSYLIGTTLDVSGGRGIV